MKRLFMRALWFGLALIGLLIVGVGAVFGLTFMGNAELHDGEKVGGFATIVADGFVSAALLDVGQGKLALIDAANDDEATAILAALRKVGKGSRDLAAVFLTHGHPDHTSGLYALPGVKVYGLSEESALVAGRRGNHAPVSHFVGVSRSGLEISHPLGDGDVVRIGDRDVHVFATPGHTRGSASYYVDGLVFLGDSADASKDHALTPAKWVFSDDTGQNVASLKRLEARLKQEKLPVKALICSHTGVLLGIDALSAFNRSH